MYPNISNKRTAYVTAIIVLFICAFNYVCIPPGKETKTNEYAGLNDTVKYVGMNTCRECHQDIYDSYIKTGMGRSFDIASSSKSSAVFYDHDPVYDGHLDLYYWPYWQSDSLYILEYRLQDEDTVHLRKEKVSYIVGSGQHTNSHLINVNGYLHQAPLTYYTQTGKWDLPPGFEDGGNTRFSRLIGLECMTCHNSYPEFVEGSENKYEFVDRGINCERCHGPGEVHVNNIRNGITVDISSEIDYSIVNPAKLPIDLQFDVCQRCHIQGNAVLRNGSSFFDFKPGMRLSDVMDVYMPVFEGRDDEHIMASHVERMKLSRCFTESIKEIHEKDAGLYPFKDALTCITCHDPHKSVTATPEDHFNSKCSGCHTEVSGSLCTASHDLVNLENNSCINCHMPVSGSTDIPHVTVHDHYIRKPVSEIEAQQIRKFVKINCINNPDPSAESRALAFIAYHERFNFGSEALDSAKVIFNDSKDENIRRYFHELVHIAYLEGEYRQIIDYCNEYIEHRKLLTHTTFDNKDAWTSYRIGEAYASIDDKINAGVYFRIAYELAPYYHEFANKYGASLVDLEEYKEALTVFSELIMENPSYAVSWSNFGFLQLVTNADTVIAMDSYNTAILKDPDNIQALLNKAALLALQGESRRSLKIASAVLKLDPGNEAAGRLIHQLTN